MDFSPRADLLGDHLHVVQVWLLRATLQSLSSSLGESSGLAIPKCCVKQKKFGGFWLSIVMGVPQWLDGLWGTILLKWMISEYPHLWKAQKVCWKNGGFRLWFFRWLKHEKTYGFKQQTCWQWIGISLISWRHAMEFTHHWDSGDTGDSLSTTHRLGVWWLNMEFQPNKWHLWWKKWR